MKELTKSEEQVMQYLWKLENCFLKDIVEQFPEPKPAYTTISTVIRVLVKKKFVGYRSFGKIHQYYPLVEKEDYTKSHVKSLMQGYFNNSVKEFVSFFANDDNININDLEEIKKIVNKEISERKK